MQIVKNHAYRAQLRLLSFVLSILMLLLTSFVCKVTALDYRISNILPQTHRCISLRMKLDVNKRWAGCIRGGL